MVASGAISHKLRIFFVFFMAHTAFGNFPMLGRFRNIMGINHASFIIRQNFAVCRAAGQISICAVAFKAEVRRVSARINKFLFTRYDIRVRFFQLRRIMTAGACTNTLLGMSAGVHGAIRHRLNLLVMAGVAFHVGGSR